jgi:hypothetical protein
MTFFDLLSATRSPEPARELVDEALGSLSPAFSKLYARDRTAIDPAGARVRDSYPFGGRPRLSAAEHMYVESMPSAHAALFAPALIS